LARAPEVCADCQRGLSRLGAGIGDVVTDANRGPRNEAPDEPGWWQASDGLWYPPESAPAQPSAPVQLTAPSLPRDRAPFLLTIGDIGITPQWVVTPNGHAPLSGSQWIAMDMSRTESKIPTWAIIMAILFALLCLIGLFFLLVKEERTTGYVEVSVRSGDLYHRTQLPVSDQWAVQQIRQLVAQAQTLAAQAR
jgi:hypothetical protein